MDELHTLPDEALIRMIREEDRPEAMDLLLDKFKPLVLRNSRARYLIGGDREDLIQEGMIGLYKAIRDYDPHNNASFVTFAGVCINNQMLNAIAASNREKNRPLNESVEYTEEEVGSLTTAAQDNPEAIVIDREALDERIASLRKKVSKFETVVLDLYLSGLDYREIAKITERTPKAIDNALQRIRKKAAELIP